VIDTAITTWIAIQMCAKGRHMALTFRASDGVVFSMPELQSRQIADTLLLVPLPFIPEYSLLDAEIYAISFPGGRVQIERTF
jgi:hypothetical protein